MGEYINKYANSAAIQNAVDGGELIKPYVALDESTGLIDWNSKKVDYSKMYFTVEALSDGDFIVRNSGLGYSINNGEWQTTSANPTTLELSTGDKVRFKGSVSNGNNLFRGNTLQFNVIGNIMSLKYGDNFSEQTTIFTCNGMFQNCTGLTDASQLILPATTLANECYYYMFDGCRSLTQTPQLPATTLASGCYSFMFRGCTSLTTAPELPVTTLAKECYRSMFSSCSSLTTAPELPATTLASSCYQSMFFNCRNLNYIKCLATDISATNCTNGWLTNVASSGTFVTPSSTNWSTGTSGIPTGWTRVDA